MNKLSIATFTNVGFWLHSRSFAPIEADLTGTTAVVTGSTGGIGLEVARQLSSLGARVVVVGRDPAKLASVRDQLPGEIRTLEADLSLMEEVRKLGEQLIASEEVDILINNVGVLLPDYSTTEEGLETSFATNVAGHFLLTNLLAPSMVERGEGRIVNVSSGGMYSARIRPHRLEQGESAYNGTNAYAQAKRAQVILTEMWADRLRGTGVAVNSMHPGWVETAGVAFSLPTFNKVMKPLLRDVGQGADTIVWLAASPEASDLTGGFFFDRERVDTHLSDSTRESTSDREWLWGHLADVTESDLAIESV